MSAKNSFWNNIHWLIIFPSILILTIYFVRIKFSECLKPLVNVPQKFTERVDYYHNNKELIQVSVVKKHKKSNSVLNIYPHEEIIKTIKPIEEKAILITYEEGRQKLKPRFGHDYTAGSNLPINVYLIQKNGLAKTKELKTNLLTRNYRKIIWYAKVYHDPNIDELLIDYYPETNALLYTILVAGSIVFWVFAACSLLYGLIKANREATPYPYKKKVRK